MAVNQQTLTVEVDVLVMGAGMSGLCTAIALQKAGMHNFVVLEKSSGLGGTWWDNRYPGAHVDVPSPLYCFSFEPNPRWSRRFAAAPEIQAYQAHCAQKHGLHKHLRLGHQVTSARFDEATGRWHITCEVTAASGQSTAVYSAQFFVCSTGPLSQGHTPAIPGLQSFAGTLMHSARWDTSVPLAGKRVGVIGTGSSAAQLVPQLARMVVGQTASGASSASSSSSAPNAPTLGSLHVFQRTANWVLPRLDRRYGALDRALMHLPGYNTAVRAFWYRLLELGRRGFEDGSTTRRAMLATAGGHLKRQVADPALRQQLQPPYPLGCKRLIYSNDYYPALCQPHVKLVTDSITAITPSGLVTQGPSGEQAHALDVLVCATGFEVEQALTSVPVLGLGGRSLQSTWVDGPQAVLGINVAHFPNLFFMLGPNTATGHTSTLLYIEPGVQWAVKAMQEVQRRNLTSPTRWLVVKPAVMQQFNEGLQSELQGAVWSQCRSWYRSNGTGRNIAIWPRYTRDYVQALRTLAFDSFDFG
jgi:cation diffusion facilitator CzcD-associated flavoprotein CzcO